MAQQTMESQSLKAAKDGESAPQPLDGLPGERSVGVRGLMPATTLPLGRLRSDFRETAAWQPQLRADEDGVVRTSFRLPDSLTSYRLTAVALSRETEIGLDTARVRAALPLAVQVFLPRFAVEKDRLQAVAVVHNGTDRERTCAPAWEVEGARVEGQASPAKVRVPARGSTRVGLWLVFDRAGPVTVRCRVREGNDADAETRTLAVQPLGREREVAFEGVVRGSGKVRLPAGFVARDLHVVLARGDLARALDGLDSLLDYPYGCVEQTMSRFLPAVVVKHACRQAPVQLPPEAAARLPDILARGLARLYHFQHSDGGWGWWEHDATDPRMSIYVVEGLVRCRLAGTAVDAEVLANGIAYVRKELEGGSLPASLAARAWLVLALAGAADTEKLGATARKEWPAPEERCQLALACRAAGLREPGERLWAGLRAWQPGMAEELALRLTGQLAFGEPLAACRESAGRLMAQRVGLRWASTQATAGAIEALAEMLTYVTGATAARKVEVLAGGKTLLAVADPADLRKLVYRVRVPASALPPGDALEVEMRADCDETVRCTVVARGVQVLDEVGPSGTDVKVSRTLETPEGKPLTGPVRVGDVVRVRLSVELTRPEEYMLLEDRRPAGCEFADDYLGGGARPAAAHHEFRDDRLCVFFGALPARRHEIVYYLRAETPGTSHLLPAVAYPMYAEHLRGETGAAAVEVR